METSETPPWSKLNRFYLILLIWIHGSTAIEFPNKIAGNPEVQCMVDSIKVMVSTASGNPSHIFVKGRHEEAMCISRNANMIQVRHEMCGLTRERSLNPPGVFYRTCVVVQLHPQFVTKVDRTFCASCFYMESVKELTQELGISMLPSTDVARSLEMPMCTYTIRRGSATGPEIRFATVGETVYHVWMCPSDSYGMLVQNCYVDDGMGNRILIIDANGCGVDRYVLQTPNYSSDLTMAFQESHVFKFADKTVTRFTCQIKICIKAGGSCQGISPPTNCPAGEAGAGTPGMGGGSPPSPPPTGGGGGSPSPNGYAPPGLSQQFHQQRQFQNFQSRTRNRARDYTPPLARDSTPPQYGGTLFRSQIYPNHVSRRPVRYQQTRRLPRMINDSATPRSSGIVDDPTTPRFSGTVYDSTTRHSSGTVYDSTTHRPSGMTDDPSNRHSSGITDDPTTRRLPRMIDDPTTVHVIKNVTFSPPVPPVPNSAIDEESTDILTRSADEIQDVSGELIVLEEIGPEDMKMFSDFLGLGVKRQPIDTNVCIPRLGFVVMMILMSVLTLIGLVLTVALLMKSEAVPGWKQKQILKKQQTFSHKS